MKPKLLDTIIFLFITPLTISTTILLFLTFLSTSKFKNKDIVPKDDSMLNMSPEHFREQQRINLIETEFNAYTMSKIERNNMAIFTINEEINDAEKMIEAERTRRISNLNEQNSQLNKGLENYDVEQDHWQGFKTNFSINFKRMGLPFSELFAINEE